MLAEKQNIFDNSVKRLTGDIILVYILFTGMTNENVANLCCHRYHLVLSPPYYHKILSIFKLFTDDTSMACS